MKRLQYIVLLCTLHVALCTLHATETRYYMVRGGQLPEDVTTVDLRPEHSATEWGVRNIYRSATARYALFEKRSDSWWQITVDAQRPVDLSAIDNNWTLCMRLRRTVDYNLTLCLAGQSTDDGYTITTATVPADGQWRTIKVPLSSFKGDITSGAAITGNLVRLHADLGYIGDEVGIDFCYLTNDASVVDEGQVQDEARYYYITNTATPRSVAYSLTDYSKNLSARYSGWMQWGYIDFPYYSTEQSGAVVAQLCSMSSLQPRGVDDDWAFIAQVQTDMLGALTMTFYLQGKAYTYTIDATDWVRDGETWNRVYMPMDQAERGTYTDPTFVAFSLHAPSITAGRFSIGSLMLTNNHSASDPDPVVPGDPASGHQIWLVNDGTPLAVSTNIIDYRLFYTDNLNVAYGNNTQRKASDPWLTLLPTNGWYSADIAAAKSLDMTAVQADWKLYARVRTTSTYRPINLILYHANNQQLTRYQLDANLLPTAQNGTWFDFEIPMSTFLGAYNSLPQYNNGNRIFSFHSDNGGTTGVEVSLQYLYFGKPGESTPAPIPGDAPLDEPTVTPITPEGIDNIYDNDNVNKILLDGHIYIRSGNRTIDLLGRIVQ